ncbi:MAG: SOS response-associated peptidase [Planctomycetota bacterium]|jgi:putative SOS response-associated peptidase YedK
MCGRFTLLRQPQTLRALFKCQGLGSGIIARYNIAPTQKIIALPNLKRKALKEMRWGLVPSWAKEASIGNRMINARSETLAEKPSFKDAYRKRRCLVFADGFYEWMKTPDGKQPIYITHRKGMLLTFAGLWDTWTSPDGEVIESCTIITTTPNELVSQYHDRMPVILAPDDRAAWLDPKEKEPDELQGLLKPFADGELKAWPVSTMVNSPAMDVAQCIEPV